jgi:hypothetical protein
VLTCGFLARLTQFLRVEVDLGGVGLLVAEPEGDDRGVGACVKQSHGVRYLYLILRRARSELVSVGE